MMVSGEVAVCRAVLAVAQQREAEKVLAARCVSFALTSGVRMHPRMVARAAKASPAVFAYIAEAEQAERAARVDEVEQAHRRATSTFRRAVVAMGKFGKTVDEVREVLAMSEENLRKLGKSARDLGRDGGS